MDEGIDGVMAHRATKLEDVGRAVSWGALPSDIVASDNHTISVQRTGDRTGPTMKFVVMQNLSGRWLWELRSVDGEPICRSAGDFADREQALRVIHAVRGKASGALVFDPLGTLYESL